VLLAQKQATPAPEYKGPIDCEVTVKGVPVVDEFELYDLTSDPLELSNRYGDPACSAQQAAMVAILVDQRAKKRLSPLSGVVPGQ
jgi:choline-sulfatase